MIYRYGVKTASGKYGEYLLSETEITESVIPAIEMVRIRAQVVEPDEAITSISFLGQWPSEYDE